MPITYDANTDSFIQVVPGGGVRGGSTYVNMTVQEFLSSPPTFFAGMPVEQVSYEAAQREFHTQMRKLKSQSSIGKHRIIPFPDLKD